MSQISKRITFLSDDWGGNDETHIEFTWRGETVHLNITNDQIELITVKSLKVDTSSMNAVVIEQRP